MTKVRGVAPTAMARWERQGKSRMTRVTNPGTVFTPLTTRCQMLSNKPTLPCWDIKWVVHPDARAAEMGKLSKSKGKRGELEVVRLARAAGLPAGRTWHTSQSANVAERACDVLIAGRPAQVKVQACGFRSLYDALDGVDLAFLRADRQPWLALLAADDLLRLLAQLGSKTVSNERVASYCLNLRGRL